MQKTIPLYFEDSQNLVCQATILSVDEAIGFREPNCHVVVVDQTACHPQGGGQPSDTGMMEKNNIEAFQILDVRVNRENEQIQHIGRFSGDPLLVGDVVSIHVCEDKRVLFSRLHTAGHLIDACLHVLGHRLKATKGYHFPDCPYVEYEGEIGQIDVEGMRRKIEEKCVELIAEDVPVIIRMDVDLDEAKKLCGELDANHESTKHLRLVSIGEYFTCPCGGTHVRSLRQLKGVQIPKIKCKKGMIQIRYKLVDGC